MGKHAVVLIPGDGVGPEVTAVAQKVIAAAGVEIEWRVFEVGARDWSPYGAPPLEAAMEEIRRCGVALKGPITTPPNSGLRSVTVMLRQNLGLYANLRPIKSMPGVPSRYQDVDLVIVRENTEGLYSGIERQVNADTAEAIRRITRKASLRIARFAFEYASRQQRKAVTTAHKANILQLSDGLFLQCAREVAADYPGIEYRERIIDALCMDLVLDPQRHDVLLCPNLYGDILSDLAAGLIGGLGLAPAANIGEGLAIFEAVHGSAPDIAGRGIANPTAVILAGAMMLAYLGEVAAAGKIENGIREVYARGEHLTPDAGGQASTEEMAEAILACILS